MNGSFVVSVLAGVTIVTLLALVAASLSRRRCAATRHALLTAAFVVALVLPMAAAIAPYITVRVPIPAPAVVVDAVASLDAAPASPVDLAPAAAGNVSATPAPPAISFPSIVAVAWLIGLAACLLPLAIGLMQVRSLGRSGLPWPRGQTMTNAIAVSLRIRRRVGVVLHERVSGPMTYGTVRPTIVMPTDVETWTDDEVKRALVHELEHIRRADWLTQCLARTLCAAYWFHPLVWIARRQLVLEAERASDDAVLRYAEASAYADQLVDLARRLSAGHQPLLAMANRHDLAARVHALLDGRLPRGRAGTWLVAAVACVAAVLVIVLSPMRVVAKSTQAQDAGVRPRFDVVSVRPCDPNGPPSPGGRSMTLGQASPGRFRINCMAVSYLIQRAYVTFANGRYNPRSAGPSFNQFDPGPGWLRSERFTIEATTSADTPSAVMQGPMLQAVLEDRFKLKTRLETREVPVLELVVAKGGSKLTPFKPGTCVPWDYSVFPLPPLGPGEHRCMGSNQRGNNGGYVQTVEAMTLDEWVRAFDDMANVLGEPPIVNKTGITGLQTFRLAYSGNREDRAAEIKEQLGLELRPGRGPREFLIIDHIERPVADEDVVAPARATGPRQ